MRRAETLGVPPLRLVLVRPILSELIGAATESATVNRDRAPSGPVKVVVTNQLSHEPTQGSIFGSHSWLPGGA